MRAIVMLMILGTVAAGSLIPARADDDDELRRYKRQAQQDRWAAEEESSKLRRRIQNLESEASESREERTGARYLNNGTCIWYFGNNVYGKC